ncbi:MAG: efflux RND transporter periplasmic adaptor subunit [Candidatus Sumerlaeota bacterium]|nr:efflux RND transporter periplasmic adaptor subunit [Candidatus Sumerlaeota bacterium]
MSLPFIFFLAIALFIRAAEEKNAPEKPSGKTESPKGKSDSAGKGESGKRDGPSGPVPVLAADAVRKDIPIRLLAVGTVEPFQTVQIKAQVSGQLMRVHFKEGQDVKKGDLLFTIDSAQYEATLHKEQANQAKDLIEAKNADAELKRYQELYEKAVVPKEDYDRYRTVAESKNAMTKADIAAVESAQLLVSWCAIRSPLDGRTGNLLVHEGNLIKANDTPALVVINQISPINVAFSIPEREFAAVQRRIGSKERLMTAITPSGDGDQPTGGELAFMDNEVSRNTGTIRLKAICANTDKRLWPGQFVTVALTLDVLRNVVVVPSQAVQTGQNGQYLFVVKSDQTVETRLVKSGLTFDGLMVIEKGLDAGEKIVTDGHLRIMPGMKVEVKPGLSSPSAKS